MLTTALLVLAALAPADTPTDEVDEARAESAIESGDPAVTNMCGAYATVYNATFDLVAASGGDATAFDLMLDLVDAYIIVGVEGDTLRFTPEARTVIIDWLHTECTEAN